MLRHDLNRLAERIVTAIAWRLPRSLAYWCAIRVAAHATTGQYSTTDPTTLSVMEMLDRWYPRRSSGAMSSGHEGGSSA